MIDNYINLLFVGGDQEEIEQAVSTVENFTQHKVRLIVSTDIKEIEKIPKIDAVICQKEKDIHTFASLISILTAKFSALNLPSTNALVSSTNKYLMRQAFSTAKHNISAHFTLIDAEDLRTEVDRLKKDFPKKLVIKPAHNASSLYVSLVTNSEKEIEKAVKKIISGYQRNRPGVQPQIVAEEYLDGPMYSVDVYVDKNSQCFFCPVIKVVTGKDIGHEDFYAYCQMAPSDLSNGEFKRMREVVQAGIKCLGLNNSSVHAELKLTRAGWKLIEIGPRIGGYRDLIYRDVYSFSHAGNDALNRLGLPVNVSYKNTCYSAVVKLYPKQPGLLKRVKGLNLIQDVAGVKIIKQKASETMCRLASEGGFEVLTLYVKSSDKKELESLIEFINKNVTVITTQNRT